MPEKNQSINGISVEYIMDLPTRQVNAQGRVFMSKYDDNSRTVFFLNDDGTLNGRFYKLPASPSAPAGDAEAEETANVAPPIRFHLKHFFMGVGVVLLIALLYIAYQFASFEGII